MCVKVRFDMRALEGVVAYQGDDVSQMAHGYAWLGMVN